MQQIHCSYHARYVNEKQYEIKDHLGNVRALVSDMKMEVDNHPNGTTVEAVVNGTNSYYPFGMTQHTLTYPDPDPDVMTDIYNEPQPKLQGRYGFNGMERDNELKGGSNSYDFGARMYDPRLGRFLSLDPLKALFPDYSPYSFASNSPLIKIDEEGKASVYVHWGWTYSSLREAGVSKETSETIAHYASTYADGLAGANIFMIGGNNALQAVTSPLHPRGLWENEDKYGSYDIPGVGSDGSQDDENIVAVSIHAMKGWWEDISNEEAIDRALMGGTYPDKNGKLIKIIGALETIQYYSDYNIENLSEKDYKLIGLAYHTIQDAYIHKGTRWVSKHEDEAEKVGNENKHPLKDCFFGGDSHDRSEEETDKTTERLTEGTSNGTK